MPRSPVKPRINATRHNGPTWKKAIQYHIGRTKTRRRGDEHFVEINKAFVIHNTRTWPNRLRLLFQQQHGNTFNP